MSSKKVAGASSSKVSGMRKEQDAPATLAPKLRFPEFRDADEWAEKEVGEVFKVTRGEVLSMTLVRDNESEEKPYPVFSSQTKNKGLAGFYSEYLYEDAITWTTDGANAGDVNYRPGKFYCTNVCGVLISTAGFANPCIAALINSVAKNYVSYVGNPKLMNGVMSKIRIPFPTIPEQQKIAECLTTLDEVIAAQSQKLDALKTHKKGLMQQLFPRAGETLPRLRFPEFQAAPEWEYAPLGKLLMNTPDYGVNAAAVPFSERLPKYLRITDISENGLYLSDKQVSVDLEPTTGNYLDEGDIVLARTGASVGKSYRYRKEDGKLVFAGFLIRVKPNRKRLVSNYLANFLTTVQFWKWVAITSARSGQPGINSTEYSSLAIPLPPTLPEQQRIATCLTSLDDLITAQNAKLSALKTHKKGLMQQLFPSPEKVEA